jgi:Arc/MetJ family transcription regulator
MKTTLDIPIAILDEAIRISGARTKRAAVLAALSDFTRRGRMRDLAARAGTSTTFMTSAQLKALRTAGMRK